jgi:hypothetical protein
MFLADPRNRPFAVQPRPSLIVRFVDGPHQAQWPSQDAEKRLTGGLRQFWLGFRGYLRHSAAYEDLGELSITRRRPVLCEWGNRTAGHP